MTRRHFLRTVGTAAALITSTHARAQLPDPSKALTRPSVPSQPASVPTSDLPTPSAVRLVVTRALAHIDAATTTVRTNFERLKTLADRVEHLGWEIVSLQQEKALALQ
jgi:hypothetical protein